MLRAATKNFMSIQDAMKLAQDQGQKFDAKVYFDKKAEYEEMAKKLISEQLGMPFAEALKMMPADMTTKYKEVLSEKKSLDTTKYLENYTIVVKEQNTNTKELSEKMDKLIEVLGGKEKTDMPIQLVGPVNLSIGATSFETAVEKSLARIKGV